MTVSYHELTYDQPKNRKAERQQSLVICAITLAVLLHSAINAGIFAPLPLTETTFPGGEFVYKLLINDYVASSGAMDTIAGDLGIDEKGLEKPRDTIDFLYTVYLDDATVVPGGKTRFASGVLLNGDGGVKSRLLEVNKSILEGNENQGKQSKETRYEVARLPKVDAVAVNHPFTGGAWSALLMRYKILPAFKKYAKEHTKSAKSPVFISTCCEKQSMCTFYMPLSKEDKFYVGEKTAEEYAKEFDNTSFMENFGVNLKLGKVGGIDWGKVWRGMKKAVGITSAKDEL